MNTNAKLKEQTEHHTKGTEEVIITKHKEPSLKFKY